MKTYIIDPRNGGFCTIEQWRKEPDPTRYGPIIKIEWEVEQ